MKRLNNVIKKIILLALMIFVITSQYNVYAASSNSSIVNGASQFMNTGKNKASNVIHKVENVVVDAFAEIIQLLKVLGVGILIIAYTYLGIQYIVASPDNQATLRQRLIGLGVATFVIFGAYNIWKMLVDIVDEIF